MIASIRILYVDDEPSLIDIGKIFLEKTGDFTVTTTLSAPEAIRLLEQEGFDAIISDYQMPGMDGIQFLIEVRTRFGPIPFILFTGRGREEVVIQAINNGADFYLQKGGEMRAQFAELSHKIRMSVERHTMGQALKESETRFRALIENASDIIRILDREGRIVFDTTASEHLLGYPPGFTIGRNPMEFIHPDDLGMVKREISEVYNNTNTGIPTEFRIRRADGSYTYVESVGKNLIGVPGVDGIVITTRFIDERKKANEALLKNTEELYASYGELTATKEELRTNLENLTRQELALRERETQLRATLESTAEGILAVDNKGKILQASRRFAEIWRIPESLMELGNDQALLDFVLGQLTDPDAFLKKVQSLYGSDAVDMDTLAFKDGRVFERYSFPMIMDGVHIGRAWSFRDITEHKQAEEALRLMRSRLELAMEAGNIAWWEMDCITENVIFNERKARMLGYPAEQFSHYTDFTRLVHPDDYELVMQSMRDHLSGIKKQYDVDYRTRTWNGDYLWVHDIGRISDYTADGKPLKLIGLVINITERKQAEEALRQMNRKLTLLSGITRHDISNQLTVLLGYLRILEKKLPDPSFSEYFQKVATATERISAMIRFTREYEAIGVNAPVWQDCRTIIDTAAKQAPLGEVMVKNDLPAGTEIFADPLVVRVFYNLMDNSVRYGGKTTTLRFSAQERDGGHVVVCEDDGDGVPAEEKEQIFQRGFGKNTGLGLALAREILDITGITISETGEQGKGARFEMMVPKRGYRFVPGAR